AGASAAARWTKWRCASRRTSSSARSSRAAATCPLTARTSRPRRRPRSSPSSRRSIPRARPRHAISRATRSSGARTRAAAPRSGSAMAPHLHGATGAWAVWVTVAVAVLAGGYARGWAWLSWSSASPIPVWRAVSFYAGLGSAWLAVASPIGGGDGRLLTFHMVQHLLLMTIAPPLIFLGEPVIALWRGWAHAHDAI